MRDSPGNSPLILPNVRSFENTDSYTACCSKAIYYSLSPGDESYMRNWKSQRHVSVTLRRILRDTRITKARLISAL
jgi:hypothetical protein